MFLYKFSNVCNHKVMHALSIIVQNLRHNDEIIQIFDRHPFHQIVNIYWIFSKHLHSPASEQLLEAMSQK